MDVPDDTDARLVVLGVDHPYSKDPSDPAELEAKAILEKRGNAPRLLANTLVFLALDKVRLQDLDEAIRRYLAWKSIVDERGMMDMRRLALRDIARCRNPAIMANIGKGD